MEVRGRNGKWFRAGNGGTIWIVGVDAAFQFSTGVPQIGRGINAFVVVDVVERHTQVAYYKCVWGKNGGRNGRGSVNGEGESRLWGIGDGLLLP